MRIDFGNWLPDQPPFDLPGSPSIQNAIAQARGWGPVPQCVDTGDGGVTGTPNVLFQVTDVNGNSNVFAGDGTKLYKYTQGTGFQDVSKAGGYTDQGHAWNWALFGNTVYAVNGVDVMQRWVLGSSTQFEDSPGAVTAGNLTARYIAVVRDFLVLSYVTVGAVINPNRIQWSNQNNPEDWAAGSGSQAGFDEIPNIGECRGLTGGDYGVCLFEGGTVRTDYLGGPPDFFQFDNIDFEPGCLEPRTVIRVLDKTYYLSKQGFRVFDGQRSAPFGAEAFDRTFFGLSQEEFNNRISYMNIPSLQAIGWLFVSASSPDSGPDALLLYSYVTGKAGLVLNSPDNPFLIDCVGYTSTSALNSDQLDGLYANSDLVPGLNDARTWKGSTLEVASGINRNGNLCTFTGGPMTGIFDTADVRHARGSTRIQEVYPLIDGACIPVLEIGTRRSLATASPTWTGPINLNSADFFPTNAQARFHRYRLKLAGDWRHALGLQIEGVPSGDW